MGEAEEGSLQSGRPRADKEATDSKGAIAIRRAIPSHQGSQAICLPALRWAKVEHSAVEALLDANHRLD